ncbi:fumarylacetoacetate hydrolase family protein [candidate division KSB1 bacterium]|nr:fumarylacetoacetate hydrolase family protein [candidate division KSB1 bacterium]RQW09465.1 MAG: FAA hydrolase family protein [candidate division KSB1 bacterium]
MENFSQALITQVIQEVQDLRGLDDLVIQKEITYDVPIQRPTKILCMARNYRKHAEEFDHDVPTRPIFFGKLPSSLLPHEGDIRLPRDIGRVDHEVELAVVIGKTASRISESDAMDVVAAYTIANDISARALQKEAAANGEPWTLCKGMDTFLPIGPYLIPADAVADPHNLDIELSVSDETKQRSNTKNMIFPIPEMISYMSRHITLAPGDIICTGTPEGVGPIKPGDLVQAAIEGMGVLRNRVVGE